MKTIQYALSLLVILMIQALQFPAQTGHTGGSAWAEEKEIDGVSSRVLRDRLVDTLVSKGITDKKVIAAMSNVQRHEFVLQKYQSEAYDDHPLPIGMGQTISQPFIVAYMTEVLGLKGGEKVLEIGTGSGYQAAVLAEIAGEVYSIEILEPLARSAEKTLDRLGYKNIHIMAGDGYRGWPEHAPFDAVIVTAAPDHVPQPLVEQLKVGGRMVIPVGEWFQSLIVITKDENGVTQRKDLPVRFVPMTGEAQK
jgi:protein-L-isoaspartate(D-aspartate) O-methyltransferase